ncbi:sulfatase [Psychromarinibacter halotolerans]|uniref:Sulfatase n=1 Tax=Psychromarinibacter halotolerans TaxID=1775175 RepID=A0ABV7GSU1_9RHOB|nr:sulfatase-like hydrolase/transferase [Psychromarinibacter halotolerans]MDF0595277.1 sulfatase-like hydrolase/transferase [Psychromarinibacter halotolerans]
MARNILWIMADELRASSLGCYAGDAGSPGWDRAATPHIDALAAGGVRFSRHWCNSPACVPSRCSMLTAQPPERTGIYSNEGAWKSYPVPRIARTFPEHFADMGYRTANIGKAHLPSGYAAWQDSDTRGSGMNIFAQAVGSEALQAIVPRGIPSPVGGRFPDDVAYPPEAVTDAALRWLNAAPARDGPFLLRVSYLQPHTPVLPPDSYRARYHAADFPGHDLPAGTPSRYETLFAEAVGGPELSQAQMQQAQADYAALVTWLDDQVGRLIGALDEAGLGSDTVVVLNADHGASLGEGGLLAKVVHAPQSQRIPLIVRAPGLPAGTVRNDASEALDLARTLSGLAGIAPDPEFAGCDLFDDPPERDVFSVIGQGHAGAAASSAAQVGGWPDGRGWPRRACIRSGRWRFDMNVRQDGGHVLAENEDPFLCDTAADPFERYNLAADPAHAARVARFRGILLDRAAGALEPAFVPAFSAEEVGEFAPPKM